MPENAAVADPPTKKSPQSSRKHYVAKTRTVSKLSDRSEAVDFDAAGVLEPGLNEPVLDIPRVEIFEVGDYGPKGKYNTNDLEAASVAYAEGGHEAPVTLDHVQGGPAYGFAKKIWREGGKLFAHLTSVPLRFASAVKHGRYKQRSIELYRDAKGVLTLRAITFLGAHIPHVKGMAPVAFAEGSDDHTDIAWAPVSGKFQDEFPEFAEPMAFAFFPTIDPFPGSHGAIIREGRTDETLGHYHFTEHDEDGNGFTSKPLSFGPTGLEILPDGHIHEITDGAVAIGGDGVEHGHGTLNFMGEDSPAITPEEAKKMTEPQAATTDPKAKETPPAVIKMSDEDRAELVQLRKENTDLAKTVRAQGETLTALQAARQADHEATRFSEVFDKAARELRVSPKADKDRMFAQFRSLPNDSGDEGKFQFGEGDAAKETSAREMFLEDIAARPAKVEKRSMAGPIDGEIVSMGRVSPTGEGLDAHNVAQHVAIQAYMDKNNMKPDQYGEAASIVFADFDKAEGQ